MLYFKQQGLISFTVLINSFIAFLKKLPNNFLLKYLLQIKKTVVLVLGKKESFFIKNHFL